MSCGRVFRQKRFSHHSRRCIMTSGIHTNFSLFFLLNDKRENLIYRRKKDPLVRSAL
jgi:hypothetical protein